ncbi:unnamed protein product, partial [Mesorhabditis spiculigera]
MSSIHYKFRASVESKTVRFEGLHILCSDLKREIYTNENIKSESFDLVLANAQTKRSYLSEEMIPRNATIIVQRVPKDGAEKAPKIPKGNGGLILKSSTSDSYVPAEMPSIDPALLEKMTEEERQACLMDLSTKKYHSSNFQRRTKNNIMSGPPPPTYVCNRCNQTGHWYQNCPMANTKKATGMTMDELIVTTADDPHALLHSSGRYVVPRLHYIARNRRTNAGPGSESPADRVVPSRLTCPLCSELLRDAMITTCCGVTFCAECISENLLSDEERKCPKCARTGLSLDDNIIPNGAIREAVQDWIGSANRRAGSANASPNIDDHLPTVSKVRIGLGPSAPVVREAIKDAHQLEPSEMMPPGVTKTEPVAIPAPQIDLSRPPPQFAAAQPAYTQPMVPQASLGIQPSAALLPPGVEAPRPGYPAIGNTMATSENLVPPGMVLPPMNVPPPTLPAASLSNMMHRQVLSTNAPFYGMNLQSAGSSVPVGPVPIALKNDLEKWEDYLAQKDSRRRRNDYHDYRRRERKRSRSYSSSSSESDDDRRRRTDKYPKRRRDDDYGRERDRRRSPRASDRYRHAAESSHRSTRDEPKRKDERRPRKAERIDEKDGKPREEKERRKKEKRDGREQEEKMEVATREDVHSPREDTVAEEAEIGSEDAPNSAEIPEEMKSEVERTGHTPKKELEPEHDSPTVDEYMMIDDRIGNEASDEEKVQNDDEDKEDEGEGRKKKKEKKSKKKKHKKEKKQKKDKYREDDSDGERSSKKKKDKRRDGHDSAEERSYKKKERDPSPAKERRRSTEKEETTGKRNRDRSPAASKPTDASRVRDQARDKNEGRESHREKGQDERRREEERQRPKDPPKEESRSLNEKETGREKSTNDSRSRDSRKVVDRSQRKEDSPRGKEERRRTGDSKPDERPNKESVWKDIKKVTSGEHDRKTPPKSHSSLPNSRTVKNEMDLASQRLQNELLRRKRNESDTRNDGASGQRGADPSIRSHQELRAEKAMKSSRTVSEDTEPKADVFDTSQSGNKPTGMRIQITFDMDKDKKRKH